MLHEVNFSYLNSALSWTSCVKYQPCFNYAGQLNWWVLEGEQSLWWREGRKKLGRNCALQKVFLRLVGHDQKEFADGQCVYVHWWPELFCAGGEGRAVVFKSEPSLCYAVNEYFYQLIIQLPLDVWTVSFIYFYTPGCSVFSECNWQGVSSVSQSSDNRLLYMHLFVCLVTRERERDYICALYYSLIVSSKWYSMLVECCLPSIGGSITVLGTMSQKLNTAAFQISNKKYVKGIRRRDLGKI